MKPMSDLEQLLEEVQQARSQVEKLLEENRQLQGLLDAALAECSQMHDVMRDVIRGWAPPARN